MFKNLFALLGVVTFSFGQIQSPAEFLGYELGDSFTRHHKVVEYYQQLAAADPDRVVLEKYGETNEGRPLYLVFLGSKNSISNREQIRVNHLKTLVGESTEDYSIVWLSYNVHGNESVSTEASMKTAFELLTEKSHFLDNTLVIIDPCINPDGRDRYVNWYNQTKNKRIQPDPNSAEHFEPWHSGRTNHYVFDLNRDWVWMTQVESEARLPLYQKWQPQIHVDFHEQGVNQPYYFAPAAEPLHEVITDFQKQFQDEIGRNHAKYFDANGWLYFTKERFDLLYPSYGDTYPTFHGAIGMTYEQGGSGRAGLAIRNSEGNLLTLKDRIEHHFTTGISTVEMASKNGERLQREMANFVQEGLDDPKTYILSGNTDNLKALTQLLDKHQINYGQGKGSLVSGYDYRSQTQKRIKADENSLIIPAGQTKNKLIQVLLEPRTKLSDSITYDITAWSLPFTYDVNALLSTKKVPYNNGYSVSSIAAIEKGAFAYVMNYNGFSSLKALAALLDRGMTVRTSYSDFKIAKNSFQAGSSILLAAENPNLENTLERISQEFEVSFKAVSTGFVDQGKDFGSPSVTKTKAIKIALLKGNGISSYNFGEWWHFLENDLDYPVSVLDTEYLGYYDLDNYDVLIMPDGNYRGFNDNTLNSIEKWVSDGGKLIAQSGALSALSRQGNFNIKLKDTEQPSTDPLLPYELQEREGIKNYITGAVFKTKVDSTHPVAYGYDSNYYGLKLNSEAYELLPSGNLASFAGDTTPIAGFAGSNTLEPLSNSLFIGAENHGRGNVVYFTDNPVFRGFWFGAKRFVANALFFDF
jgi:hypothetical protein